MIRDAQLKAEDVSARFNTLRVLVDTVDTRVSAFVNLEKSLRGPYWEFVRNSSADILTLLCVICEQIHTMEQDQNRVVSLLDEALQGEGGADCE